MTRLGLQRNFGVGRRGAADQTEALSTGSLSTGSLSDLTAVVCPPPLFDPPSNELIKGLAAGLLAHGQCPRSPSRYRFAAFSDVVDRGRSVYSCGGSSGPGDLSPYRIPVSPLARHRKTKTTRA